MDFREAQTFPAVPERAHSAFHEFSASKIRPMFRCHAFCAPANFSQLKALELGAVETLIVFEDLEVTRWTLRSSTGSEIVLHTTKQQVVDSLTIARRGSFC